jgi:hypothetical protein
MYESGRCKIYGVALHSYAFYYWCIIIFECLIYCSIIAREMSIVRLFDEAQCEQLPIYFTSVPCACLCICEVCYNRIIDNMYVLTLYVGRRIWFQSCENCFLHLQSIQSEKFESALRLYKLIRCMNPDVARYIVLHFIYVPPIIHVTDMLSNLNR